MRLDQVSVINIFSAVILFLSASVAAAEIPDPLNSPQWQEMHEYILNNEPVIFDDKVIVITPDVAEDPLNVPVSVDATALTDIQDIVVFADLNPIQEVLRFKPNKLKPYIAFRFKVEQGTPVRAAVKTADGLWHVGGKWLDASGGGCTAPSVGRTQGGWEETLMDLSVRSWPANDKFDRIRMRIMHPMDTGLAPGIPAFYLQELVITDSNNVIYAQLDTFQPVSENPVISLDLQDGTLGETDLFIRGRDNNGNRIEQTLVH